MNHADVILCFYELAVKKYCKKTQNKTVIKRNIFFYNLD